MPLSFARLLAMALAAGVVVTAAGPARAGLLTLTFDAPVAGTIRAADGSGTGFTARLPGTGGSLPANDPNLSLDTAAGLLKITSTRSDLNGQQGLGVGEYLGTRLTALGYTGAEDFSVSATFRGAAYNQNFDQFGLYVGTGSTTAVRGGSLYVSFFGGRTAFTTGTTGGVDLGQVFNSSLAALPGDDVTYTLSRSAGVYALGIQNLTHPSRSGSLTFNTPAGLAGATDLYVGVFAANSQNNAPFQVTVDRYSVNVASVPEPSGTALLATGVAGLLGYARRRR